MLANHQARKSYLQVAKLPATETTNYPPTLHSWPTKSCKLAL